MDEKNDADLYAEAMREVDRLVEDALDECQETAQRNRYETDWVIHHFKRKFAEAVRERGLAI